MDNDAIRAAVGFLRTRFQPGGGVDAEGVLLVCAALEQAWTKIGSFESQVFYLKNHAAKDGWGALEYEARMQEMDRRARVEDELRVERLARKELERQLGELKTETEPCPPCNEPQGEVTASGLEVQELREQLSLAVFKEDLIRKMVEPLTDERGNHVSMVLSALANLLDVATAQAEDRAEAAHSPAGLVPHDASELQDSEKWLEPYKI